MGLRTQDTLAVFSYSNLHVGRSEEHPLPSLPNSSSGPNTFSVQPQWGDLLANRHSQDHDASLVFLAVTQYPPDFGLNFSSVIQ